MARKAWRRSQVYDALDLVEERTKRNGLEVFEQAMKNVAPVMEVKPRRVGGATYQIPMEVPAYRRFALATRWILQAARSRSGKSFCRKAGRRAMDACQQHRRSHPQARRDAQDGRSQPRFLALSRLSFSR